MIKAKTPLFGECTPKILVARVLVVVLILCNLAFIWHNSAKVSTASDKSSKKLATTVARTLVDDYDNLSKPTQRKHVNRYNNKIRSIAHFTEFIPLGMLFFLLSLVLFNFRNKGIWQMFLISLVFALLFSFLSALTDEVHQLFVKGRSFQFTDILTDALGSFVGCVLASIVSFVPLKRLQKIQ